MSNRITVEALDLGSLDVDGAIREAEGGVEGDTRAAFFRKAALGGGALIGGGVLLSGMPGLAARIVRDHEDAHVKLLKKALGSAPVKKPRFDFKNTTGDANMFLQTAVALEDTGVAAYAGQSRDCSRSRWSRQRSLSTRTRRGTLPTCGRWRARASRLRPSMRPRT